ncbi:hypothetical protein [Sorangium sp. So ce861]|uniref:hypothetical protein n=1 Tax=Sorangium sp. So ce861 TaxID=3133323 RepID=UPI003F61EE16
MKSWAKSPPGMLNIREAACGHSLFTTKDPDTWKWYLENLGELCAKAWGTDLPAEDQAWAEPYRKKFSRWIEDLERPVLDHKANTRDLESHDGRFDDELAPPWPMLLEAVQSACFAMIEVFTKESTGTIERAAPDPTSRLHRSYLWRTLTSDDTAEEHRTEALRAFRRGFRIERRGKPKTLTRPVPPVLKPPYYWGGVGFPEYPGPSAARERAIKALPPPANRVELAAREEELRALYASAWREDVPEEDRVWAAAYRDICTLSVNGRRRSAIAQSAYEGYLQSSGGLFNGEPARPWQQLTVRAGEPWCSFVDRVEDAPEGESESATAEAAVWEYWDTLYREAPRWNSDPHQAHWLAALRAARRKAQADDGPPEMGR